MLYRTRIAVLLTILICECLWAASLHAQTINVQHNGVFQFCAANLASIGGNNEWNFTGACTPPSTRQLTATMTYVPPGGTIVTGVTECDQIMGRAKATDPIVPFPGRSNAAPVINNFGRDKFISCHFVAPSSGASFGWWKPTEYNYSFDLTSAISTTMGDFSPSGNGCTKQSGSGQQLVGWTTTGAQASLCRLVPGRDYYLSIKPTNPAQITNGCPLRNAACVVGLSNSFGG